MENCVVIMFQHTVRCFAPIHIRVINGKLRDDHVATYHFVPCSAPINTRPAYFPWSFLFLFSCFVRFFSFCRSSNASARLRTRAHSGGGHRGRGEKNSSHPQEVRNTSHPLEGRIPPVPGGRIPPLPGSIEYLPFSWGKILPPIPTSPPQQVGKRQRRKTGNAV